jgi:hypothetical protein
MTRKLEIGAFFILLIAATIFVRAWLSSHDDLVRLQATLAAQKQTIDAADTRERERTASLKDTLAQIDALKRSAQSPAQILSELPKYLTLPQPISLVAQERKSASDGNLASNEIPAAVSAGAVANQQPSANKGTPNDEKNRKGSEAGGGPRPIVAIPGAPTIAELPDKPEARIPVADLKPLYDFVQDCRVCQAQLAAARLNASDDTTKINALTQERDAAIKALKGGGIGRRIRRSLVWFVAGAALGAVATCASSHYRL